MIAQLTSVDPAMSTIPVAEICEGVYGTPDPFQALAKVRQYLGSFAVLPVTTSVAEQLAAERAVLRRRGKLVDDMDFLIAATALEHDPVLVTRNHRHFAQIPGLQRQ